MFLRPARHSPTHRHSTAASHTPAHRQGHHTMTPLRFLLHPSSVSLASWHRRNAPVPSSPQPTHVYFSLDETMPRRFTPWHDARVEACSYDRHATRPLTVIPRRLRTRPLTVRAPYNDAPTLPASSFIRLFGVMASAQRAGAIFSTANTRIFQP
jgi:hypothetical protein